MRLWNRLGRRFKHALRGWSLASEDPELLKLFGVSPTTAGVPVTESTALNYSAVWAAVTIIAGNIAALSLPVYRRLQPRGKERALDDDRYFLLHDEPNPETTSTVFRETLLAHVLTWGNGYAEIERNGRGKPLALWQQLPNEITPERSNGGRLQYRLKGSGTRIPVPADDMIHVPGLGFNGILGYSPITMARESLGMGLAAEQFGAAMFGNQTQMGMVLEHPGELTEGGKKNLKDSLEFGHQGQKAFKLFVAEEGMKLQQAGIPPKDAQFLETRRFQILEVARWFNLAPHKLRDLERATFSNIEEENISHVTDTLRPWIVRVEQELNRKLFTRSERRVLFVEFLLDSLLRGNTKSRFEAYRIARQWGWMSADDVLEKENANPLPDGQGGIYLVPRNMIPADRVYTELEGESAGGSLGGVSGDADSGAVDEDSRARVLEAQREVFVEAVGRMIRRQANAARRAAGKGGAFHAWVGKFFGNEHGMMSEALLPAVTAHLSLVGRSRSPVEVVGELVGGHLSRAQAEILAAVESDESLEAAVDALVSRWEIERPAELAAKLMKGDRTDAKARCA